MTSVAIVLWSTRGWQLSHSTTPASASFESAASTRDAKQVLPCGRASRCRLRIVCSASTSFTQDTMPGAVALVTHHAEAVPELPITSRSIDLSSVAKLQRAVRMFPVTVSTAVQDAETDTPLSLLSFTASKARHASALRAIFSTTSVSWLDCSTEQFIVDKVCEFARAFFNPSDDKPWQGSPGHCASPLTHTLVADVILLVCTFTSELELATSTADKQYNHHQRA
ncbi:hypothetical protein PTSG_11928 [Salpingoeca rosetta]|uniref:Uncharacterized protein n=1 Tax=Salpingoeca rosetta (strain ATCC 50818 / BSB-021) TaxID=946362 RepID=F2U3G6_SALR5|nr:uncharacterized protein PTSG_11928 [Salpingoeca rosetta]EGD82160.1 hypothetical protein PTSG_11928 [Salpingoeca rosetta]|eukprot:XP_004996343.1 hypothetical protein PTSG_11928 [Salpingoeca rosetta]